MTRIILIGTGTPNPNPYRMGPCVAVQYNNRVYLFDAGVGLVRRLNEVAQQHQFKISDIHHVFITHLHSDHTLGLSDLMLTPWVLGRNQALNLYGPKGLKDMITHLKAAYHIDIHERTYGLEKANTDGCSFHVFETTRVFQEDDVQIEAFPVNHGNFEAYGYKVTTPDKSIVISGDTAPCATLIEYAKNCDVLVHEVYYHEGLKTRSSQWQKYHSSVHTSTIELAEIANHVQPKTLVLYHQLFMQEAILEDNPLESERIFSDAILREINMQYNGNVIYGKDLMVIE